MAENKPKDPEPIAAEETTDDRTADLGVSTPSAMRVLAEDLPVKDKVQKAYKDGMLASSSQEECRAKVAVVDGSPDAADTPSGAALKKVAGISNDTERGEKYLREKTAKRWGYVPVQ